MAISHCYWHLVVKNGNFTLLLTSSGLKWQFQRMAISHCYWHLSRMAISHCYWHLVVKNGNIPHCYWHLVGKNGNFTMLLTSSGQEWQFHIVTDIYWSRMAISHCFWHLVVRMAILQCYWHLVIKNANYTLLLISSGQEWQFHIATDI